MIKMYTPIFREEPNFEYHSTFKKKLQLLTEIVMHME